MEELACWEEQQNNNQLFTDIVFEPVTMANYSFSRWRFQNNLDIIKYSISYTAPWPRTITANTATTTPTSTGISEPAAIIPGKSLIFTTPSKLNNSWVMTDFIAHTLADRYLKMTAKRQSYYEKDYCNN